MTIDSTNDRQRGIVVGSPVLAVDGLCVEFLTENGWAQVVKDVSFSVTAAETVGIVGESGSGKTVTAMAIMGLVGQAGRVTSGSIALDGVDLTKVPKRVLQDMRGSRVGMIFQEPMTALNPAFTVGEQIAETLRRHRDLSRAESRKRAVEMLSRVHIPNAPRRASAYPHEFSGGMRQRVMIAMALCCEPKLLIADEPTTALDVTVQAQILDLIHEIQGDMHMSILFITHDLGVVADVCDRVLVMYAGQIVEQAPVRPIFRHPSHPYTSDLLRSLPSLLPDSPKFVSIGGQPPSAGAMPSGCRYHPRCSYAREICSAGASGEVPVLQTAAGQSSRCVRVAEPDFLPLVGTSEGARPA